MWKVRSKNESAVLRQRTHDERNLPWQLQVKGKYVLAQTPEDQSWGEMSCHSFKSGSLLLWTEGESGLGAASSILHACSSQFINHIEVSFKQRNKISSTPVYVCQGNALSLGFHFFFFRLFSESASVLNQASPEPLYIAEQDLELLFLPTHLTSVVITGTAPSVAGKEANGCLYSEVQLHYSMLKCWGC